VTSGHPPCKYPYCLLYYYHCYYYCLSSVATDRWSWRSL